MGFRTEIKLQRFCTTRFSTGLVDREYTRIKRIFAPAIRFKGNVNLTIC